MGREFGCAVSWGETSPVLQNCSFFVDCLLAFALFTYVLIFVFCIWNIYAKRGWGHRLPSGSANADTGCSLALKQKGTAVPASIPAGALIRSREQQPQHTLPAVCFLGRRQPPGSILLALELLVQSMWPSVSPLLSVTAPIPGALILVTAAWGRSEEKSFTELVCSSVPLQRDVLLTRCGQKPFGKKNRRLYKLCIAFLEQVLFLIMLLNF